MEYDAKTVDALKELMRIMQEHCVVSEADMLRIARNDRAYALQLIAAVSYTHLTLPTILLV